jgi:2OG-Fe(II) oxygenase superfamily
MEKIYLDENLFYVENFLSEEALEFFTNFYQDPGGWNYDNPTVPQKSHKSPPQDSGYFAWKEINEKIVELFPEQKDVIFRPYSVARTEPWHAGLPAKLKEYSMGIHGDNYGHKQAINQPDSEETFVNYGCIIYLNDDFEGGETVYPKKSISIKPEKNKLVCHPASDDYVHGVLQNHGNNRYTIALFIFNPKFL